MENIKFICPYCNKEYNTKNAMSSHKGKCKNNPNYEKKPKSKAWIEAMSKTKGHPKYGSISDDGRKRLSEIMKGEKNPMNNLDSRKKLSESMKRVYKNKSIWRTQIEKRKSIAEQYFDECFPLLETNYHVDRYFLDLADPQLKIYIEIDGEQHYNDEKVIKHDLERTEILNKLGWTCLKRVRWSEFCKLSYDDRKKYIQEINVLLAGRTAP